MNNYIKESVAEFKTKFAKEYEIESEPHNYIHVGLNHSCPLSTATAFLQSKLEGQLVAIEKEMRTGGKAFVKVNKSGDFKIISQEEIYKQILKEDK